MREYTATIGEHAYKGVTASAKAQFEALHITLRTGLVVALQGDPSDMAKVAAFAHLKYEDVQALVKLILSDCVKREHDKAPVAENLFRDEMQDYYLLLAVALKENLGGFWKLRRQADSEKAAEQSL